MMKAFLAIAFWGASSAAHADCRDAYIALTDHPAVVEVSLSPDGAAIRSRQETSPDFPILFAINEFRIGMIDVSYLQSGGYALPEHTHELMSRAHQIIECEVFAPTTDQGRKRVDAFEAEYPMERRLELLNFVKNAPVEKE